MNFRVYLISKLEAKECNSSDARDIKRRWGKNINQKNYRNKFDIIQSVLTKVNNGCKKTHIMYGANLSTVQLRRYLDLLLRVECIAYDNKTKLYKTTQKGNDLLEVIYEMIQTKRSLRRSQKRIQDILRGSWMSNDISQVGEHIFNKLPDTPKSTACVLLGKDYF